MDVSESMFGERDKVVAATLRGGRVIHGSILESGMVMHTQELELRETTEVGSLMTQPQ